MFFLINCCGGYLLGWLKKLFGKVNLPMWICVPFGVQIKGKIFFLFFFFWIFWPPIWPSIFLIIGNGINGAISSKCHRTPESAQNFLNGLHSFNNPKWNIIPLRNTNFSEKATFTLHWVCCFWGGVGGQKKWEKYLFCFFLNWCPKRNANPPGEVNFSEKKLFLSHPTTYKYRNINE